jgi:hypothetical protein
MYGLKTKGRNNKDMKPARKRTRFLTNSDEIAKELQRRCNEKHEHQPLTGGRAAEAARYPEGLCKAICIGLMRELRNETQMVKPLMSVSHDTTIGRIEGGAEKKDRGVDHEEDQAVSSWMQAWDDITGVGLNPKEVRKARMKEIDYIVKKQVWVKMPRAEALKKGYKIVGTRWIDVNKGDEINPDLRSRLVSQEFNVGKTDGIFAATPPLEAVKMLISESATMEKGQCLEEEKVMMVNDVARAFFEAKMHRDLCVEIPEEAKENDDWEKDVVGYLKMSLYGTRDAAANFQKEVTNFMKQQGYTVGKYNVCTFYHKEKRI